MTDTRLCVVSLKHRSRRLSDSFSFAHIDCTRAEPKHNISVSDVLGSTVFLDVPGAAAAAVGRGCGHGHARYIRLIYDPMRLI